MQNLEMINHLDHGNLVPRVLFKCNAITSTLTN